MKRQEKNIILVLYFFLIIYFSSCEKDQLLFDIDSYQIKSETLWDRNSNELLRTINYSYNADGNIVKKAIFNLNDTLSNTITDYYYDKSGKLAKLVVHQIGWTEDLRPKNIDRITDFTNLNGVLVSEKSYVDLAVGYEQKFYFYTEKLLDSVKHYSLSVKQNLERTNVEYFKYNGNLLIESGYSQNDQQGLNTKYDYSDGFLIRKYDNYWSTTYSYEGSKLIREVTNGYDNLPYMDIAYIYSGDKLIEKTIDSYTVYSENPMEPYLQERILYNY